MLKIYRWCGVVGLSDDGVVVAHEILVSAPVLFGFRSYWDLVGLGPLGFRDQGFWDRLENRRYMNFLIPEANAASLSVISFLTTSMDTDLNFSI